MTEYKAENGLMPYSSGEEFMRHYREMTRELERYEPKQTVTIRGCFGNIERSVFDGLCKKRRNYNE